MQLLQKVQTLTYAPEGNTIINILVQGACKLLTSTVCEKRCLCNHVREQCSHFRAGKVGKVRLQLQLIEYSGF